MPANQMTADDVIALLGLRAHPEGGHYRETWRDSPAAGRRGAGTAIYYLLKRGERSHWHRVDATEIWHHYAGAGLALRLSADGGAQTEHRLGSGLEAGERPQVIVPKGMWQSAECLGTWSLVGCTVSPAFEFEGFELAPPDWSPGA